MHARTLMLSALLLAPASALAADREVSFEVGANGLTAEDNWFLFSEQDSLTTLGVRVGHPVMDRLAVIAGWHHGAHGTHVSLQGTDEAPLAAACYADAFTLGAKADWDVAAWFRPYAAVQAVGQRTLVRLDDDIEVDDNPNQIQRAAFSPGGVAVGGVDLRVPFAQGRMAVASHLELGYQLLTPADLDELGSLETRGLVFRWGLGMRF